MSNVASVVLRAAAWLAIGVVLGACSPSTGPGHDAAAGSHPRSLYDQLRTGDAFLDLAGVRADGDGFAASVASVYFDGDDPWPVEPGDEVSFRLLEESPGHRFDRALLEAGFVLLADLTHGRGSAPDYFATVVVEPSGTGVEPEALEAQFDRAVARDGFTPSGFGRLLADVHAHPRSVPPELRPPSRDDRWYATPPEERELGEDDAPAEFLADRTVRTVLRLELPPDLVTAARVAEEPWVLTVLEPGTGVVYSTELRVGPHEMPVFLPAGRIEVRLRTERRPVNVVHVVGSVASPVEAGTAGTAVARAPGPFVLRVGWREGPRASSTWDDANPIRLL